MKAFTFSSEAMQEVLGVFGGADGDPFTRMLAVVIGHAFDLSTKVIEGETVSLNFLLPRGPTLLKDTLSGANTTWGGFYSPLAASDLGDLHFQALKPVIPCLRSTNSFLVVEQCPEIGSVKLGLLYLGFSLTAIVTGSRKYEQSGKDEVFKNCLARCLTVSVRSGVVVIAEAARTRFVIERGNLIQTSDFEHETNLMLSKSHKFLDTLNGSLRSDVLARLNVRSLLKNILQAISDQRTGAIILCGVDAQISDSELFHPGGLALEMNIGSAILRRGFWLGPVFTHNDGEEIEAERSEAFDIDVLNGMLHAVANLSATDGAIVVGPDLSVKGAGVFVKSSDSSETIGGARRRAAESFVRRVPNTAAICISQDGDVTAFSS